jgi:hypothetical protein
MQTPKINKGVNLNQGEVHMFLGNAIKMNVHILRLFLPGVNLEIFKRFSPVQCLRASHNSKHFVKLRLIVGVRYVM